MKDEMDDILTDREKEFLARKRKKDAQTTVMRTRENVWLRKEHERSVNRLPNEYRHKVKDRSPFPSQAGLYWSDAED